MQGDAPDQARPDAAWQLGLDEIPAGTGHAGMIMQAGTLQP
jgi:hypothetical protein